MRGCYCFIPFFFSLLFLLVIIFCLDRESKYFKLFLFISAVLLPIFTLNINENSSSFYICQIVSSMELKVIGFDSFFFFYYYLLLSLPLYTHSLCHFHYFAHKERKTSHYYRADFPLLSLSLPRN